MKFLDQFTKDLKRSGLEVGASQPPRYWLSSGNYALNKIISGSFLKAIPQGRIQCFAGNSGSGKSYLACSAMREAQQEDVHLVVLDSENALDNDFVSKVGVDTESGYSYIPVDTIPQAKKVVSKFITGFKKEYGDDDPEAPKVLFVIDSLDMLMTKTEQEHFQKGETKGDQGQRNKQLKAMLREFVQAVKRPNISMIVTSQVYRNQDLKNGEGVWIVSDAIKYSLSQIVLLTKLKLRETGSREVHGIRMKCEGYKTRFAQPYQTVTIEVPYNTGMDPFNGLLDVAVEMGVVEQTGSRYKLADEYFNTDTLIPHYSKSWVSKDFAGIAPNVLDWCEAKRDKFLEALLEEGEETDMTPQMTARKRRKAKVDEV